MTYRMAGGFRPVDRFYTARRLFTWAALWLALGACGGGILTARMLWPKTQRQTEAPLPCVERPGSPARMILHLPGRKMRRERE